MVFLLLQIQQVNQGCRSSCTASEEFVANAKPPQTYERHCAATANADNEVAMETQPLRQKCLTLQWAREGALSQSTENTTEQITSGHGNRRCTEAVKMGEGLEHS